MDNQHRHLFDGDTILNVYNNDVINLSVGAPGPDLLKNCGEMMLKATKHRLEEEKNEGKYYLFQYGPTSGLLECRNELKNFLSRRYGDAVDDEDIILTCGATHGIQLIINSIISPNGIIFVEQVTYMIALEAFKQFPLMKIIMVPMKNDYVDFEKFDIIINNEMKNNNNYLITNDKIYWAMFYTIPTFHNPTGMTLPPDICKKIIDIARKYSIIVVCDDVYNLLNYNNNLPPHRLFWYDDKNDCDYQGGNVISNGSFSKILSPAIRLGWLECPTRVSNILKQSGIMKSGGAVNHYVSGVIASLLHLKLQDEYVDLLIKTYQERLNTVCNILDRYLPRCCSYKKPNGGYFIWIKLHEDCDACKFVKWCQDNYKVTAIPGNRFSLIDESKNYLRLSIAFHSSEILKNATQKLCQGLLIYIRQILVKK